LRFISRVSGAGVFLASPLTNDARNKNYVKTLMTGTRVVKKKPLLILYRASGHSQYQDHTLFLCVLLFGILKSLVTLTQCFVVGSVLIYVLAFILEVQAYKEGKREREIGESIVCHLFYDDVKI
jgi:hypothetical protein